MNPLFVKIQGRVHGPFDEHKLKAMIRQGKLSRIHLVSEDNEDWFKAGQLTELFAAARNFSPPQPQPYQQQTFEAAPQAAPQAAAEPVVVSENSVQTTQGYETSSGPTDWYYEERNEPMGPVTESALRDMIANGILVPNSMVWRDGLADWQPVHSLAELQSHTQAVGIQQSNSPQTLSEAAAVLSGKTDPAKIFGILNLTFGTLGFLGTIYNILRFNDIEFEPIKQMLGSDYTAYSYTNFVVSILACAALIAFGIGLLLRTEWGRLGTLILCIVLIVWSAVISPLMVLITASELEQIDAAAKLINSRSNFSREFWLTFIFGTLVGLVYYVLALIFMFRIKFRPSYR